MASTDDAAKNWLYDLINTNPQESPAYLAGDALRRYRDWGAQANANARGDISNAFIEPVAAASNDFSAGASGAPPVAPAPPAPTPVVAPPSAPAQPRQSMSDFQRRYAQAYMAQEQKGAAPTTDERLGGSIAFDLGDGKGMRSYDRGAQSTAPAAFGGDRVFGQDRSAPTSDAGPVPRQAGSVSSPGALANPGSGIDSEQYRNYLRNTGHLDEFEQEKAAIAEAQAKRARGELLTADPFADQNRAFQLEALKTQLGITKDRAHLENERDVKLGPMIAQANADAKSARAKVDAIPGITPEQRAAGYAKAEELHQEALKEINKLATRSQTSAEIASAPLPGS